MKYQTLATAVALFGTALAAPCPGGKCGDEPKYEAKDGQVYPAPPGGWESVKYPELEHYPEPKGGWESVDYSGNKGGNKGGDKGKDCPAVQPPSCPDNGNDGLFQFTSTYRIEATPDQVVGPDGFTGGLEGAFGTYDIGLNSFTNTICYNITIFNFRGDYQSAADTSTHIHEAAAGETGPPRIAFPNPVVVGDDRRVSIGCLMGPFTTGIENDDGEDTGAAFNVGQIEANPAGFFADVHSSLAVPGAVRGQLA